MIGKAGKGDGRIDRVEGIDQSLVGTKQAGAFGVQIDPPGGSICRTDAGYRESPRQGFGGGILADITRLQPRHDHRVDAALPDLFQILRTEHVPLLQPHPTEHE
jgi:hypothetical protein